MVTCWGLGSEKDSQENLPQDNTPISTNQWNSETLFEPMDLDDRRGASTSPNKNGMNQERALVSEKVRRTSSPTTDDDEERLETDVHAKGAAGTDGLFVEWTRLASPRMTLLASARKAMERS